MLENLGHKTVQMTMRYSHLSPNMKAEAVAVLDSNGSKAWQHSGNTALKAI
jgi:hypothetical protein